MKCIQCGSDDIVTDVQILEQGHYGAMLNLRAGVHRNPTALVFKQTRFANVIGNACADCGFLMLAVSKLDARGLKKAKPIGLKDSGSSSRK